MSISDRIATVVAPGGLANVWRETWRYFAVSAFALGLDFGLLVLLTSVAHVNYLISAAVGFIAGTILSYLLSIKLVFKDRAFGNRWFEFAGFAAIGLLGLAVNEGLMKLFVDVIGVSYVLAKIGAAGFGFFFNFALRKALLFSKSLWATAASPSRRTMG